MDARYLDFISEPNSDTYKGFNLKGTIKKNKVTGRYLLVLSNGEIEISGFGGSYEQALSSAFDKIDEK